MILGYRSKLASWSVRKTTIVSVSKIGSCKYQLIGPFIIFAQIDGVSQRFEGTEDNRRLLMKQVQEGHVRKVLAKYDVNLSGANSREEVLSNLQEAMTALIPFYEATRPL